MNLPKKNTSFELTCEEVKSFTTFDIDVLLLIEQLSILSRLKNRMPELETDVINSVILVLEKFVDLAGRSDDLDLAYQQGETSKTPTPQALIYMGGGLIYEVLLHDISENIQFILVDEDTDGGDPECLMPWKTDSVFRNELYVTELPVRDIEEDDDFGYSALREKVTAFLQGDSETDDGWKSDPKFPVSDWQYEVANGDTRRGYEEWVDAKK